MTRRVIIGGRDLTEHIQSVIDQAPPLSAQQIAALRGLLTPPQADADPITVTVTAKVTRASTKAA